MEILIDVDKSVMTESLFLYLFLLYLYKNYVTSGINRRLPMYDSVPLVSHSSTHSSRMSSAQCLEISAEFFSLFFPSPIVLCTSTFACS